MLGAWRDYVDECRMMRQPTSRRGSKTALSLAVTDSAGAERGLGTRLAQGHEVLQTDVSTNSIVNRERSLKRVLTLNVFGIVTIKLFIGDCDRVTFATNVCLRLCRILVRIPFKSWADPCWSRALHTLLRAEKS